MLDGDTARRSVAGVPQYASGGLWGVGRGEEKKSEEWEGGGRGVLGGGFFLHWVALTPPSHVAGER